MLHTRPGILLHFVDVALHIRHLGLQRDSGTLQILIDSIGKSFERLISSSLYGGK